MKKGFTLIEIIGVIILLGLVAIMAFPSILNLIRETRGELDKATEDLIFTQASIYVERNQSDFVLEEENVYCITLRHLAQAELISLPIHDSRGNELDIDKDFIVEVSVAKENESLKFVFDRNDECK